jgi:hypothetical protein
MFGRSGYTHPIESRAQQMAGCERNLRPESPLSEQLCANVLLDVVVVTAARRASVPLPISLGTGAVC